MGTLSGRPRSDVFARSPPCGLSGAAFLSSSAFPRAPLPRRASACSPALAAVARDPDAPHGGDGIRDRLPPEIRNSVSPSVVSSFVRLGQGGGRERPRSEV